jgi:signal transduction histidine kinase
VLGGLLRVVLALLLVGVLAFLYLMSESGELRRQPQISAYLGQLRDIDSGWNRAVAAARSDSVQTSAGSPDQLGRLQSVLGRLQADTAALGSESLNEGVRSLREEFNAKRAQVEQFKNGIDALRSLLRTVQAEIVAAREEARRLTPAAPAALRPRIVALDGQLLSLNAELFRLYVQPDDAVRQSVQALLQAAAQPAAGLPEALHDRLLTVAEPVGEILRQEQALSQLAQQIDLAPTAPRINSLSNAFDVQFRAVSDEKERYRVYLVFYSAALLVFLAYVVWQLGRSYAKINQANEALKAANETLEHRVEDRTKELSEALKHLKESETMLIQTEKMSSLGQMVAGIAHEINTPLAYVKSSLATLKERMPEVENIVGESTKLMGMLERGDASDEQLSEQFARVSSIATRFQEEEMAGNLEELSVDALHGIDQISEIILNLKNFSRLDRSKVSRFDLNEGLESTLVIARNLVKHKTVIRRFGEIPLIECSPSQMNQVFLNLVTNAAQATNDDESGEITITTGMAPNGQVRVDVADNGHGIPEKVIAKIFDPFFTTKDVGKGTGLGLSIAYKIVQEHGGRIEVRSKIGLGTLFTVFLPVKAVQPQALAA